MDTRILVTGAIALIFVACTVTSSTTPGSTPAGGASAQQIDGCKRSCDKMKFFQCSSADEQARCYADCDQATPAQIQVFTGCADNSVCDPACRTNIQPKPAGGSSGSSGGTGGGGGGGGATAGSCGTACDKLVQCSLIKIGDKGPCVTECTKSAYQYQIDCVNNATCDKISSVCGSTTGGSGGGTSGGTSGGTGDSGTDDTFSIQTCQTSCDQLNFFSCLSAQEHSTCRDQCTTSTTAKRDTFRSCVDGSGSDCAKGQACYATFQK